MPTPHKDDIITMIEDESRGKEAFDDDVMKVLRKMTCLDLFKLQRAFNQSYEIGRRKGREDNE